MDDFKNDNLIVDVDTGIDDALALWMLIKKAPEHIVGITTCGGNVDVNQTTKNTLGFLELLNSTLPVYKGSNKSLAGYNFTHAKDYHGEDGMCNIQLPNDRQEEDSSAIDFIIKSAKKIAGNISIICLAAPTNLARAIKECPEIANKINSVVLMGGAINVAGNQTKHAEFNFFQDPEAVDLILKSIKTYIVPLDVTHECVLLPEDLKHFANKDKLHDFFSQAVMNWYDFFGNPKKRKFELYDPLTACVTFSDILEFKQYEIAIQLEGAERGAVKTGSGFSVDCAMSVEKDKFMSLLYNI